MARSALPLRAVEVDFAPDSTGFSASKFEKWYDHKYGVQRTGQVWVKAHIMTGVKTNILTAVEIKDKDAADSPQFGPMVNTTAQNFTINEVSADKAYLSHHNLEQVESLGETAFVPFKVNSVDGDGVWGKMFHYFHYRREKFLKHYHKRSNRSKTDVAMVNEVLCKFLCHNICCVIMEQCVLGIEAEFWGGRPAEETAVILPLKRNGAV